MKYQLNKDYSWCVDMYDIKLINATEHCQLILRYPDAAIFALIHDGYKYQKLIQMVSKIAHTTEKHAEEMIGDVLDMLIENKVIVEK